MDINSMLCIYYIYSFYGICWDVYNHLDYETHATDKTMRYLQTWGYNIIKHDDRSIMHMK